jgi:putative oxidoreductase
MIGKSLGKHRDLGLLIIRIGLGIAFMVHGWPKIKAGPHGPYGWESIGHAMPIPPAVFWGFMAALAEFGGGLLLIVGFAVRPVAAVMCFNMAVALCFHLRSPEPMNSFSAYSHALEAAVVFLGLVFLGPGKYSVDRE